MKVGPTKNLMKELLKLDAGLLAAPIDVGGLSGKLEG